MRPHFFVFLILSFACSYTNTLNLPCEFRSVSWAGIGSIYTCHNGIFSMTDESNRNIDSISGAHQSSKSNSDPLGVWFYSSTIFFAPRGLENHFTNVQAFGITSSKLKELKQADLKEFPNLRSVEFNNNDLEVLEAGLFDFNPKLEGAIFRSNKISQVNSRVFDSFVNKMKALTLSSNVCQFTDGDTVSAVNQLIAKVQSGHCDHEIKTTTTPAPTTTETSKISVLSLTHLQEQLAELAVNITKELTQKNEDKTSQLEKKWNKKINDAVKDVQNNLEAKFSELISELKQSIASDKTKSGSCSCNQFEERVKFIENAMGVVQSLHHVKNSE